MGAKGFAENSHSVLSGSCFSWKLPQVARREAVIPCTARNGSVKMLVVSVVALVARFPLCCIAGHVSDIRTGYENCLGLIGVVDILVMLAIVVSPAAASVFVCE